MGQIMGHFIPQISIPDYVLEDAGLDPNCKLTCTVERGRGEVRVTEAKYRFDLTDLRPDLLKMFREYGICLSDLEEKMIQDTVVYC